MIRGTGAALVALMAVSCTPAPESGGSTVAAVGSPMDNLDDGPAGDVVRRAITWAGGWDAWASKESVRYTKLTTSYRADPPVETTQIHQYRLHPTAAIRVDEDTDEGHVTLINNMSEGWRIVDGVVDTSPEARGQARNPTFGSHYIFSQPWKLTDPGAQLEYIGEVPMPDGTMAEGVRARYAVGVGDAGGQHVWTFFFDPDGKLVANTRAYGPGPDGYDFTAYGEHREVAGIRMAMRRTSYISNEARELVTKTSQYDYSNVVFDAPIADSLFLVPRR